MGKWDVGKDWVTYRRPTQPHLRGLWFFWLCAHTRHQFGDLGAQGTLAVVNDVERRSVSLEAFGLDSCWRQLVEPTTLLLNAKLQLLCDTVVHSLPS